MSDLDLDPYGAFSAAWLQDLPIPERIFVVPGMIPAGTVTTLDGDGGTGKSTAALQACVAAVLGRDWLGLTVRQGPALYLSAEDDVGELHRRLVDITAHYAVDLIDLADLHILPRTETGALMATAADHGDLVFTDLVDDVAELMALYRPVLVVLDSRADIYGANENDRAQVRQFVTLLRRMASKSGAAVLLLAHPSLTGMANGSGSSGSTAWNNSVRSRLYLSRPGQEGVDPNIRVLATKKANYAAGGTELRIRWEAGAFVADGPAGLEEMDEAAVVVRAGTEMALDDIADLTGFRGEQRAFDSWLQLAAEDVDRQIQAEGVKAPAIGPADLREVAEKIDSMAQAQRHALWDYIHRRNVATLTGEKVEMPDFSEAA